MAPKMLTDVALWRPSYARMQQHDLDECEFGDISSILRKMCHGMLHFLHNHSTFQFVGAGPPYA